jgi:hypothetical protein
MVHSRAGLLGEVVPFELGIEERCRRLRSIAVEHLDIATHALHVLRHRLTPFLGEPFSGSTTLVEVVIDSDTHDQPINPLGHKCWPLLNRAGTVRGATGPARNSKNDSVAYVPALLQIGLILLVWGSPIFEVAAACFLPSKLPIPRADTSKTAPGA